MINKKHILAIDFILIVGSLFLVAGLVGYSRPLVIAPTNDLITKDSSVLFSFEKAEKVLIDDNVAFSSPIIILVEDNILINLKPGIYYWKVEGLFGSDIRKLTIESEIDLKLRETDGDDYEVVNAGNTVLNVGVYDGDELKEEVVLDVDEELNIHGNKFIGRQYE